MGSAVVPLDPCDAGYLGRAIAWAHTARERGNRPFGAAIVSAAGAVLAEAYCNTSETGDCTGHAETNAVRLASSTISRETLQAATLYSSAEPCVMCAGAIFWSGIARVVFGIDAVSLRVFRGERAEQRDAELSCRDVFAASPHPIERPRHDGRSRQAPHRILENLNGVRLPLKLAHALARPSRSRLQP